MSLLFTRAFYPFYPLLVTHWQSPAVAGQVRYDSLGLSPWSDSRTMADGTRKRNCRRFRNTGRCNQSAVPVAASIWTLDASALLPPLFEYPR